MKQLFAALLIAAMLCTLLIGGAAADYSGIALVGSTVTFGNYPAHTIVTNGACCPYDVDKWEYPVEWTVLSVEADGLILISNEILAVGTYYQIPQIGFETITQERFLEVAGYADWEHSFLRDFLNHEFFWMAFTAEERAHILPMTYTDSGREFTDVAILPSAEEIELWLPDASDRAIGSDWALRNFSFRDGVAMVNKDGNLYSIDGVVPTVIYCSMRPVIKVDFDVFSQMNQVLPGTLMEFDSAEDTFRTGVKRDQIHSITFRDTLTGAPAAAVDASQLGDGSVLSWLDAAENGLYDLTIAAEGGVRFPTNSNRLLSNFGNAVSFDFGNGVDTSRVHWMAEMFDKDYAVETLDLRCFDTGDVCDMHDMFRYCYAATQLDLSSFDTTHVSNMEGMFCYCTSMESLNLSNFCTDYLAEMDGMFEGCDKLTQLDISGFDTARVRSMNWVFIGSNQLLNVDMKNFTMISTWGADTFSLVDIRINNRDFGEFYLEK